MRHLPGGRSMEGHLRVRGVEGANLSPTTGSPELTFQEASPVPPRGRQQAEEGWVCPQDCQLWGLRDKEGPDACAWCRGSAGAAPSATPARSTRPPGTEARRHPRLPQGSLPPSLTRHVFILRPAPCRSGIAHSSWVDQCAHINK